MSASAEVPDFASGITNTLGINKLWRTDQQEESALWRERQNDEKGDYEDREKQRREQTGEGKGEVAPVSIADEKRKETGEGTDHDGEVHGVPRSRTTPQSPGGQKSYDWPTLASLALNQEGQTEHIPSTESRDEASGVVEKEQVDGQPSEKEESTSDRELKPSRAPFLGALRPFFSAQKLPRGDSSSSNVPQSVPPLEREDPFQRQRPGTSGVASVERPTPQRRQYTMPASGRPGEAHRKGAARSRWQNAAHNLRLPLRRRKTDRQAEQSGGGSQVIATLQAGAPAATLIATHMLSDERSHHRVPVIVDLLKVFHMCTRLT
jgi:hypothetical protein